MTAPGFRPRLAAALRGVRPTRILVLLVLSLAAGLAGDWLRHERVVFPAPLPVFRTVSRGR